MSETKFQECLKIENNKLSESSKVYILDTNVILSNANSINEIAQNGDNLVVIPETVLDEVDDKKNGFTEINFQAREFSRMLSDAVIIDYQVYDVDTKEKDEKSKSEKRQMHVTRMWMGGVLIDIISLSSYASESAEKSIRNDRKILECSNYAQSFYKKILRADIPVVMLTYDMMCRIRAISYHIRSEALSRNSKDINPEFIKRLPFTKDIEETGVLIEEIDPNYKIENYSYEFKKDSGEKILATVRNGVLFPIDTKSTKSKLVINPRNDEQELAIEGMLNPFYKVVLIDAIAGSGKTLLALAAGMRLVKDGMFDKIVYIRNSIDATDKGEEVGFLSGNEEKFKVYNYPLYDTIDFIAREMINKSNKNRQKANKIVVPRPGEGINADTSSQLYLSEFINTLIETYNIEAVWNGSIRGRTIAGAYVIIDEVQNFSRKSLKTVMSRLDSTCKAICIGSNRQIDNLYVNKYTNGLSSLLAASVQSHTELNMFATSLTKVERGPITEFAERIFD